MGRGRGDTILARERWGRGGGGHHPSQDDSGRDREGGDESGRRGVGGEGGIPT